jgi:hypothetical protein
MGIALLRAGRLDAAYEHLSLSTESLPLAHTLWYRIGCVSLAMFHQKLQDKFASVMLFYLFSLNPIILYVK